MNTSGLLGALIDAWSGAGIEVGPDPARLPGLIERVEEWLEDPLGARDPKDWLEAMRVRIAAAHDASRRELAEWRSRLSHSLVAPAERSVRAYADLEEALDQLLGSSRSEAPFALEALREASRGLEAANGDFEEWVRSGVPRCLRCGASDGCGCGVEPLILDDEEPTALPQAELGPELRDAYAAYQAVVDGALSFPELLPRLAALERSLAEVRWMARCALGVGSSGAAADVDSVLERVFAGLERIRSVEHNRRMRDLHLGWSAVVDGVLVLRRLLHSLSAEAGG